jgi:hypothetical protein
MSDFDHSSYIEQQFKNSIIALASEPEVQVKIHAPGCITCDLALDFDSWYRSYLDIYNHTLTEIQRCLLARIDTVLEEMGRDDFECLWVKDPSELGISLSVLQSEKWVQIRELAHQTLKEFNWQMETLPTYVRVSEGVWHKTS